jgi:hypothetical protein
VELLQAAAPSTTIAVLTIATDLAQPFICDDALRRGCSRCDRDPAAAVPGWRNKHEL